MRGGGQCSWPEAPNFGLPLCHQGEMNKKTSVYSLLSILFHEKYVYIFLSQKLPCSFVCNIFNVYYTLELIILQKHKYYSYFASLNPICSIRT